MTHYCLDDEACTGFIVKPLHVSESQHPMRILDDALAMKEVGGSGHLGSTKWGQYVLLGCDIDGQDLCYARIIIQSLRLALPEAPAA